MKLKYYIKKIFFKKDKFERLNVADVIWAKRYKNRKQEKQIPEGHENGPYIIVRKKKNKLYCLKCTSVEPPTHCENLYYSLGKIRIGTEKNTYVKLSEIDIIRPKRFLNYMSRINEEQFNNVNKGMYLLKKQNPKFKLKKRYCKFYISVGDIIMHKKEMMYVVGVDKKHYYANSMIKSSKGDTNTIKINGIRYNLDKNKTVKIRKWLNPELIGRHLII